MGRHAYTKDPNYTGWKTRNLLEAQGRGAKIITTDPKWEGREVEYKPRDLREVYSWHVIGEDIHEGRVRSTFCKPVTKSGGPWSIAKMLPRW